MEFSWPFYLVMQENAKLREARREKKKFYFSDSEKIKYFYSGKQIGKLLICYIKKQYMSFARSNFLDTWHQPECWTPQTTFKNYASLKTHYNTN